MLGDISAASEIYLVCGYTDMRKSIDGLRDIVEGTLKDVYSTCVNDLPLFEAQLRRLMRE